MKDSRLIELYASLDKVELRQLKKFVRSPFFNKREDVIRLNDYLSKKIPFKDPAKIHREFVFKQIFPREPYDEKQMGYVMSFLFRLIKSYLAYREFTETPQKEQIYLARVLRRKGLTRIFEKELLQTFKTISEQPLRNVEHHLNKYLLQFEKCQVIAAKKRTVTTDYEQLSDSLIAYFIGSILKLSCMLVNMRVISSRKYSLVLLDETLKMVEDRDYSEDATIVVYYNVYKAFTEEQSEVYFYTLREALKKFQACFPKHELTDIYLLAINYCIKKINVGDRSFFRQVFEIYKEGLSNGAFLENDVLTKFTYSNIVKTSCALKEFAWGEEFIYEYRDNLPEGEREKVFSHNLAYLYFKKPDYEKAMQLLQNFRFNDLYYDLDARRMLLIMYYEMKDFDALESLLDSFKNFIYRHEELGYRKHNYLNLIKYTRRILQIKPRDKEAVAALKAIMLKESIPDRTWLLEQLDKV